MTKWFMDTEFNERGHTHGIDLISIALVSDGGEEYYAVSSEFDGPACGPWLRENVIPHLPPKSEWKPRSVIRDEIEKLLLPQGEETPKLEIWAYFADYDWVVFCQLFGAMIDLPKGMPWWCRELKQEMETFGVSKAELPKQEGAQHDALEDARWVRDAYVYLQAKYGVSVWERESGGP